MMHRRRLLALAPAALLAGCEQATFPLPIRGVLDAADALTFAAQRLLLPANALVREFPRSALSARFPAINTTDPDDETYRRLRAGGFADWRLPVNGLVTRDLSLSLSDLRSFPARTQITQHNCVEGWSAIGEWTGVPLAHVLVVAGLRDDARYLVFDCTDGYWDSIDLADAFHPQTILAYGMNGGDLPVTHGAPVRLRVERQLGYKSLKYVSRSRRSRGSTRCAMAAAAFRPRTAINGMPGSDMRQDQARPPRRSVGLPSAVEMIGSTRRRRPQAVRPHLQAPASRMFKPRPPGGYQMSRPRVFLALAMSITIGCVASAR